MLQAVITHIDTNTETAILIADGKLYKAKISKDLEHITAGALAQIEIIFAPSLFKYGACTIKEAQNLNFYDFNTKQCIATTQSNIEKDFDVLERIDDYMIVAESSSLPKAIQMIIDEGLKYNANMLYNVKISHKSYLLSKNARFIVSAKPAIVKHDEIEMKPGVHLDFDKRIVRRNSPNDASTRYIRVLLVCLLIIVLPILLRLGNLGTLSTDTSIILSCLGIMLSLAFGLYVNYNKECIYRVKEAHFKI